MNEELMELLGVMNSDTLSNVEVPNPTAPPQEVEITPDMRANNVVVNRSRKTGKVGNAMSFLANPVDAIGNAGRQFIQGNANRAALQAFESGENITGATNRFADPELVESLLARRQQGEFAEEQLTEEQRQFNESIQLDERAQDLAELNAENDVVLQRARLNQDAEQFNQRFELLQEQQALDERIGDARIGLLEAQTQALLREDEEGAAGTSSENLALRTNEFLELLNERNDLASRQLTQLKNQRDQLQQQIGPSVASRVTGAVTGGAQRPASTGDAQDFLQANQQEIEQLAQINDQIEQLQQEQLDIQNQRKTLQNVQAQRLGGAGTTEEAATTGADAEDNPSEPVLEAEGTVEQPVQVNSLQEANNLPPGSIFINPFNPNEKLRLNADGTKTPVGN